VRGLEAALEEMRSRAAGAEREPTSSSVELSEIEAVGPSREEGRCARAEGARGGPSRKVERAPARRRLGLGAEDGSTGDDVGGSR